MYVWNVALKTARECIPILGRYLILQLHAAKLSKTLQIQNNSDLKSKQNVLPSKKKKTTFIYSYFKMYVVPKH